MCGILGIFDMSGGRQDTGVVESLLPTLAHRGPDDRGVAALGPVVFGHTRLSILGIEKPWARQPLKCGRGLLNFNGEIYNFELLARRLKAEGIRCEGGSDTEVFGLCLENWGVEKTLESVDAMFAFAWYDRNSKMLTLARDPLGEKPLYWANCGNRIWFASEIKTILKTGDVTDEPNLSRIDDYLYTSKVNGAETIFADVREVGPGELIRFQVGQAAPRQLFYWKLEDAFGTGVDNSDLSIGDATAIELNKAISSRCLSDVPLGILLSGGIDSCTIAEHLAKNQSQDVLQLLFADNETSELSERKDVENFLDFMKGRHPAWKFKLNAGKLEFDHYLQQLERITWYYDEPVQFYNSPLLANLCGVAGKKGLKVLLSGEGSDEIFFGYDRFLRTSEFLVEEVEREQKLRHLYFGGGLHSMDVIQKLTEKVADGAENTAPWQWLETHIDEPPNLLQQIFSQKFRLQTLLQRQDRIGMADSIEIRVPFLRPELVKWSNKLPLDRKVNLESRQTKICLRAAMQNRLPPRILSKSKDGFPSDMMAWLTSSNMHKLATDLIKDSRGFCQNYLDGRVANSIIENHFSGKRRLDTLVWNLVSLEIWHRVCRPSVGNGL